jgi:hypothetical protein
MTQRIYELFEQTLKEFKQEHKYATYIVPDPIKEKFAELIVKECLNQVDKVDAMLNDDKEKTGVAWVGLAISKHFGVE